jgi:hypothetical protein
MNKTFYKEQKLKGKSKNYAKNRETNPHQQILLPAEAEKY